MYIDYKYMIIAHDTTRICDIPLKVFFVDDENGYDTNKPLTLEQAIDYCNKHVGATIVVCDACDLSYQGYFNSYDVIEYEIEWENQTSHANSDF